MTVKVTNTYNLKLTPSQFGQNSMVVNCSQYDSLYRVIQFNLYNGNAIYSIPEGSVVTIRGTKKDMTGFEYECDYSNNVVTFPIQQQITIFPGKVPAELRITNEGEIIGSWNFIFQVEPSPLSDETIISETELPLLEQAIEAAGRLNEAFDDIAEFTDETYPNAIEAIQNEGATQVANVTNEGTTQKGLVESEGTTQIENIEAEGTAQKGLVTSEGTTQVANVQAKGTEVLDSIPADYTELSNAIDDITNTVPKTTYTTLSAVSTHDGNRAYANTQYNRIAMDGAGSTKAFDVYSVTAGTYRIHGHGNDTTAGITAVVGDKDIIADSLTYCTLYQQIFVGDSTYTWHDVVVDIEQDGFLYVNCLPSIRSIVEKVGEETEYVIKRTYGVIKTGTSYMCYSPSHGAIYKFITIAPAGPNNLYDYRQLAYGHFENGSPVIDNVIWTGFTDQVGPISFRLHNLGNNEWSGGYHTKTIDGTSYPTAQTHSVHVYVDGIEITDAENGLYEGKVHIEAENYLYVPSTITGADLSTATLGFIEERTFKYHDTLEVEVKMKPQIEVDVGLYYGMQGQDLHTDTILLPTAGIELNRADLSTGKLTESEEWRIMMSDANGWHYDMVLSHYGLGSWNKNDGTGTLGRVAHYAASKIYYVLYPSGTLNIGDVLYWAGRYDTYHD